MNQEPEDFEIVRDSIALNFIRIADQPLIKIWDLLGPVHPYRCGQIVLVQVEIKGLDVRPWAISNIWLWFDLRGRGIMREFIPRLLQHVHPLCSDIHGTESPHAIKMWQALNPSIIENPKDRYGESIKAKQLYVLYK